MYISGAANDRLKTEDSVPLSLSNDAGFAEMKRHRNQDGNNEITWESSEKWKKIFFLEKYTGAECSATKIMATLEKLGKRGILELNFN